jgi:hypothetical protein
MRDLVPPLNTRPSNLHRNLQQENIVRNSRAARYGPLVAILFLNVPDRYLASIWLTREKNLPSKPKAFMPSGVPLIHMRAGSFPVSQSAGDWDEIGGKRGLTGEERNTFEQFRPRGRGGGGTEVLYIGRGWIHSRLLRTMTFHEKPDTWFSVPQIELIKYKVTAPRNVN